MDACKTIRYQKTAISYICRNSTGYIITKEGKNIGNIPVFLAETLAVRNALIQAINNKYSKVIIKSHSLFARHQSRIDIT